MKTKKNEKKVAPVQTPVIPKPIRPQMPVRPMPVRPIIQRPTWKCLKCGQIVVSHFVHAQQHRQEYLRNVPKTEFVQVVDGKETDKKVSF